MVPDIPTFAVDDGFSYLVPEPLESRLGVGSLVRVPLGGRRVRGTVVGVRTGDAAALRPVAAVSADVAVLDPGLLETLRWAALHYVAPLAALLAKTRPPNLPGAAPSGALPPVGAYPPSPLPALTAAVAAGGRARSAYLIGPGPWAGEVAGLVGPVLAAGGSALVVAATVTEAEGLAAHLTSRFAGRVVIAHSGRSAAEATAAWTEVSTRAGTLVVGTREAAYWPIAGLRLAVVIEEGRRAMKERQTPTVHVRDLLRRRAAVERFTLVFAGPVPTGEALVAGAGPVPVPGRPRPWPLVEVVDRTEDPPGSGLVLPRVVGAIRTTVRRGGRVFVFSHRRGYAPAFRCDACRLLRICSDCGARADLGDTCPRCGAGLGPCRRCGGRQFEPLGAGAGRVIEELGRRLGGGQVGPAGEDVPVWVGTERDLAGLPEVQLAVIVDADGLILAPHYRAGEEALRTFARVAAAVGRLRGRRCIVQTARPDDEVITALRRGEPVAFLERDLERRAAAGAPPAAELILVELGDAPEDARAALQGLAGAAAEVWGPLTAADRTRFLLQGRDLGRVRTGLRRLVQDWRDAGVRVRIDADPIDL